ncbi:Nif11-like leader peptide family natural product precursor [Bradyrhizobium sp. CCBAU 45389]|uniref:Nif11-like leader peptide family natural product precursor n=1 Tax=Bradyrhizobium sp. CCBAU 45389 TaxID=858429 RepID=UPI002305DBD7|nr:Nif11-like leader peptide family natural product precursor [Bradyrhizobium sp. CCBAU 45389]
MSRTDIERFVNDLGNEDGLLERVKPTATGLASIVAIGKSLGYSFTLDEAKSCIRARQKLTTKRLAGGTFYSSDPISTGAVQAVAEVATSGAQAAEAASDHATAVEPAQLLWLLLLRSWPKSDMPSL